jgi:hypothetical protein
MHLFAEAPVHSLPWYFGVCVFAVWCAAALGFVVLVRRRLRARAERRRDRRRPRGRRSSGPVRDDRSLGSGTDVERW